MGPSVPGPRHLALSGRVAYSSTLASTVHGPPSLRYRAYAKVNLTLEVLGRRDDGYHEIASLVHTISLADDLHFELADTIHCAVEGLELESDANLVVQAARQLATATRISAGASIALRKRIPAAAGLGGGSSDAATTLVALDRLWGAGLSRASILALAAELGSDVPYFVRGGCALMRGRGERLAALPPVRGQWLALLVPRHAVPAKTASLYSALTSADFSTGEATRRLADRLASRHPTQLADALLANTFARPAQAVFPGLAALWRSAEAATRRRFHLSGAGPALFALAPSATEARLAVARLSPLGEPVFVARTVARGHAKVPIPYPLG